MKILLSAEYIEHQFYIDYILDIRKTFMATNNTAILHKIYMLTAFDLFQANKEDLNKLSITELKLLIEHIYRTFRRIKFNMIYAINEYSKVSFLTMKHLKNVAHHVTEVQWYNHNSIDENLRDCNGIEIYNFYKAMVEMNNEIIKKIRLESGYND